MKIEQTQILHETSLTIKGDEPFLFFGRTDLIVNFHDNSGRSHNFFQGSLAGGLKSLQNGDVLRFELVRVRTREVGWWEYLVKKVTKVLRKTCNFF